MGIIEYFLSVFKLIAVFLEGLVHLILYKIRVEKYITTDNEENISGKVCLVTGGSMGMGKASAREFAKRGAIVVIGDLNLKRGQETVDEIQRETGNNNVCIQHLDLSDMDSVVEFARAVAKDYPKIKILLNNAGLGGAPDHNNKTKDGFNVHMAVNHLGHFLLTNLLIDNLKSETNPRVVSMASSLGLCNELDLDDLMMDKSGFGFANGLPYSNTKFCNALFIKELGRRMKSTGIKTYALCPGVVNTTLFHDDALAAVVLKVIKGPTISSPETAAANFIMFCALDKSIGTETGTMYRFRKQFSLANRRLDDKVAKALWDKSAQLVKLEQRLEAFKS